MEIRNGELPELKENVISDLVSLPLPLEPDKELFEPLLMDFLVFKLNKVLNSYLEGRLDGYGHSYTVKGIPDKAGACPCCGYLSIDVGESGLWDICPVCFWENGGDGPNHMTLETAKNNFRDIGAIDKKSLGFVEPDGPVKYARSNVSFR